MDCKTARNGVRRGISRASVHGGHAGANLHKKIAAFPRRDLQITSLSGVFLSAETGSINR